MNRWVVGIDLGQRSDRTVISAIEIVPTEGDARGAKPFLDLRFLRRLPVGQPYTEQVAVIARILRSTPELVQADVVVDSTGVGIAVADLCKEHFPKAFTELTITSGQMATSEGWRASVPKRDLISRVSVAMQARRLRVARGLPEAEVLYSELASFGFSITDNGNDVYGARTGHDDTVLSVAYCVWKAEASSSANEWIRYMKGQIASNEVATTTAAEVQAHQREGLSALQLARIEDHRYRQRLYG